MANTAHQYPIDPDPFTITALVFAGVSALLAVEKRAESLVVNWKKERNVRKRRQTIIRLLSATTALQGLLDDFHELLSEHELLEGSANAGENSLNFETEGDLNRYRNLRERVINAVREAEEAVFAASQISDNDFHAARFKQAATTLSSTRDAATLGEVIEISQAVLNEIEEIFTQAFSRPLDD